MPISPPRVVVQRVMVGGGVVRWRVAILVDLETRDLGLPNTQLVHVWGASRVLWVCMRSKEHRAGVL